MPGHGPKKVLHILGSHGVCIGASGAGVATLISTALGRPSAGSFILATFLCVFGSYRLDYLKERLNQFRGINIAFTASLLFAGFALTAAESRAAALFSLVFPVSTYFYARGLKPLLKSAPKDIPGFKAIYTASCWGLLAFFGLVFFKSGKLMTGAWIFLFTFLRMIVNSIACDFKDIEADSERGIVTLPLALGPATTLRLLHGVNVLAAGVPIAAIATGALPSEFIWLTLSGIWPAAYLVSIARNRTNLAFLSATVIDIEFLFWLPLLLSTWS